MALYFKHQLCGPTSLMEFLSAVMAENQMRQDSGQPIGTPLINVEIGNQCEGYYDALACYDLLQQYKNLDPKIRYQGTILFDDLIYAAAVGKENAYRYPMGLLMGYQQGYYDYGKVKDVMISKENYDYTVSRVRGIIATAFGFDLQWIDDFTRKSLFLPEEQMDTVGLTLVTEPFLNVPPYKDQPSVTRPVDTEE